MAKAVFVKKAQKDYKQHGIKKGESYYWWKFSYGSKQYSKTAPTRSQLTQSEFLSTLYAIEDSIEELSCVTKEDFDAAKEEIMGEIETLKEETESKLENMPEHLQESSDSGILLRERVDALDQWHSDIDNIECEYDEDEIRNDLLNENSEERESGEYDDTDLDLDVEDKIKEIVSDAISDIQSTSHGL